MSHPTEISGVDLDKLALDLTRLRYDVLARFLDRLSEFMEHDAEADMERGRAKLSWHLHKTSVLLGVASVDIGKAWEICDSHEEKTP